MAVTIREPLDGSTVGTSVRAVWSSDVACGTPAVSWYEGGTLMFASGPLSAPDYVLTGLPDNGVDVTIVADCDEGGTFSAASVIVTSDTTPVDPDPADPDPSPAPGGGQFAGYVGVHPDASVALSSGMTEEQLSDVGGAIALTFATAFGVRMVLRTINR